MATINFTKMHGLGNDYLFIDCFRNDVPEDLSRLSQQMSDRHFGIGSDGIVLMMKPDGKKNDVKMRIFNSDGSEAEMCGNASRCVAKYLFDRKIVKKKDMKIETLAGIIKPKIIKTAKGKATMVEVDMGVYGVRQLNAKITVDGTEYIGNDISVGNPHFVIFVDDLNEVPIEKHGALIEKHPIFPNKTNVEFVQVKNRTEVIMRVWERGSGVTLACGTGASATGVAAYLNEKTGNDITVHLLGGPLQIRIAEDKHVFKTGPAEEVFSGEYESK